MKKIFLIVAISICTTTFTIAAEKSNCENLDKLSKKYAICIKEKIKSSEIAKKFNKFKESKTIFDLFKKN